MVCSTQKKTQHQPTVSISSRGTRWGYWIPIFSATIRGWHDGCWLVIYFSFTFCLFVFFSSKCSRHRHDGRCYGFHVFGRRPKVPPFVRCWPDQRVSLFGWPPNDSRWLIFSLHTIHIQLAALIWHRLDLSDHSSKSVRPFLWTPNVGPSPALAIRVHILKIMQKDRSVEPLRTWIPWDSTRDGLGRRASL